jgi:hypothetical protein
LPVSLFVFFGNETLKFADFHLNLRQDTPSLKNTSELTAYIPL